MLDEPANPLNSLSEEFIRDALNWLRRHYTMLMIAQRLSTVRPGALDHSAERRPGHRASFQAEPLAAGCLLAKLHDAKNNEMGSHVSETP